MNIFPHLITGKFNHLASQIDNLNALPHIKHKYFTAMTQGPGLQNKLTGFGNRHEKTGDLRVSNRYRTTCFDLFLEARDHGTIRTQHVTKTSGNKTSIRNMIQ